MRRERQGHIGRAAALATALLMLAAGLASRSLEAQQTPRVTSARLYVFDCGVLKRGEPTAYNLTREQVGSTDFSDACYLVAHPRGTLLWDVGIIPDDQITPGGVEQPTPRGNNVATRT